MDKRLTRFRISHSRLQLLYELYEDQLVTFKPLDEHEELMREHIEELSYKLHKLLLRRQDTYTLSLTGPEALAFYQLWTQSGIAIPDKASQVAVDETLNTLGKKNKNRRASYAR